LCSSGIFHVEHAGLGRLPFLVLTMLCAQQLDSACDAAPCPPGVVEELIDCSGGEEISLETGTERKLEALMAALDRNR